MIACFPALLNYNMSYVFNGNYVLGLGKKMFIASGSRIYYSGLNVVNETIWIPGTLAHPFIVHVSIVVFYLFKYGHHHYSKIFACIMLVFIIPTYDSDWLDVSARPGTV